MVIVHFPEPSAIVSPTNTNACSARFELVNTWILSPALAVPLIVEVAPLMVKSVKTGANLLLLEALSK